MSADRAQRSWWQGVRRGGWLALALGIAALALALRFLLAREAPLARIDLTSGAGGTTRDRIAQQLAAEITRGGMEVRLVETRGTKDELEQVDRGELDFALVSSLYPIEGFARVREVAPLYAEALHLLVKPSLADAVSENLGALRGHSVDLGEPGSTTAGLAASLLAFVGIPTEPGSSGAGIHGITVQIDDLRALLDRGDTDHLPDAVFHLGTLPSIAAMRLIREADYRLVSLPFAEAYRLGELVAETPQAGTDSRIDRRFAREIAIPPFTYQAEPPVPDVPLPTVGGRLLLVANADVPAATVEAVLEAVFDSPFARVTSPPLDRTVFEQAARLDLHAGTRAFLARDRPLITRSALNGITTVISIFGSALGAVLFLVRAVHQRAKARRETLVREYMLRVAQIERRVVELELAASLELEPLVALQRELLTLKSDALESFAAGDLGSQAALSDVLAPVKAAREHVGDLILHVRDNLEEAAETQGVTSEKLWDEAVREPGEPVGAAVRARATR